MIMTSVGIYWVSERLTFSELCRNKCCLFFLGWNWSLTVQCVRFVIYQFSPACSRWFSGSENQKRLRWYTLPAPATILLFVYPHPYERRTIDLFKPPPHSSPHSWWLKSVVMPRALCLLILPLPPSPTHTRLASSPFTCLMASVVFKKELQKWKHKQFLWMWRKKLACGSTSSFSKSKNRKKKRKNSAHATLTHWERSWTWSCLLASPNSWRFGLVLGVYRAGASQHFQPCRAINTLKVNWEVKKKIQCSIHAA